MDFQPEISLKVPGHQEYVTVIRMALGGVALLKDLSVDELDDLRMAADEACDCLLHQRRTVSEMNVQVWESDAGLTLSISAALEECDGAECEDRVDISRAVLETLIPVVSFHTASCGCINGIDMTLPRTTI